MLFDFAEIPGKDSYKLLVSSVTPRPIAWVVTLDPQGILNAAPFSFFNVFSGDPPVVGIGVGKPCSSCAQGYAGKRHPRYRGSSW